MKKGLCLFAVALLAAVLCGCGEAEKPAAVSGEKEKLNGNWQEPENELSGQGQGIFAEAEKSAAGSGEQEPLVGGWQETEDELSDQVREIFAEAAKKDGRALVPEKLLATQVVAGINYKFLCREDTTGKEYIVVVYHDLKGNSSFLSVTEKN